MDPTTPRRLALLPVEAPGRHSRPVIRRYKLARVVDASFAAQVATQAPSPDARSA